MRTILSYILYKKLFPDPPSALPGRNTTFLDLLKFSTISFAASNFFNSKNAEPYFSIASLNI